MSPPRPRARLALLHGRSRSRAPRIRKSSGWPLHPFSDRARSSPTVPFLPKPCRLWGGKEPREEPFAGGVVGPPARGFGGIQGNVRALCLLSGRHPVIWRD